MSYLSIALVFLLLIVGFCFLIYRNSVTSELKVVRLLNKNYEKEFRVMTVELRDIMSLNKMCIEKWEKSVLDNSVLIEANRQLLILVQDLKKS